MLPSSCDAVPAAAHRPSARRLPRIVEGRPDATEELLHGVLRGDGIDRQAGSQLQPRDLPEPRMDLPMPVVRRVDLLAERRCVQDEVVRAARRGSPRVGPEPAEGPRQSPSRPSPSLSRSPLRGVAGTIQISNGEREANGANATVESSSQTILSGRRCLVADEAAPRALPFADDESGRAAQLLRDAVRDLGKVVEVEAKVVRPRSSLGTPVLDHLEVVRLARSNARPR